MLAFYSIYFFILGICIYASMLYYSLFGISVYDGLGISGICLVINLRNTRTGISGELRSVLYIPIDFSF